MALKDLKSNLAKFSQASEAAANLTYGKGTSYDRPGREYSLEPFVQGGIDLGGTSTINTITGGFIRGGALMHAERLIQDTQRFGTFLISGRGIKWNATQLGLQKSNPKISKPGLNKSKANQRQWNFGVNTLSQIIGQGTGLHIKREGLTPLDSSGYIDEENFKSNYSKPSPQNGKSTNTNRLLHLFDNHISTDAQQFRHKEITVNPGGGPPITIKFADKHLYDPKPGVTHDADGNPIAPKEKSKLGKFFQKVGTAFKKAFGNTNEELYSYSGGPGSTYGIGSTNIYKYSNTNINNILRYSDELVTGPRNSEYNGPFNVKGIIFERPDESDLNGLSYVDQNFSGISGHPYNPKLGSLQEKAHIYKGGDVRNIFGKKGIYDTERDYTYTGASGKKTLKLKHNDTTGRDGRANPTIINYLATTRKIPEDNYNKRTTTGRSYHREQRVNLGNPGGNARIEGNTTVDLLNALDVFRSSGDLNSDNVRDLIRFRFEAVDSDDPTYTNTMVFRAFLDDMTDNYNATHNEYTYNGRGEPLYTYNGFNREISVGFKIAAQSSKEMKPLYRKLNYLASNVAPEYSSGGRMRTPLMRLTVGAYHHRLPGVISSLSIKWQKDYPWEITLNMPEGGSTTGMYVLPHILDVSVNFKPIHSFIPQKSINNPFIVPHKDMEIANTPGRKSWNTDDIPQNEAAAVQRMNTATKTAAIPND